jgi:tetratricopeptide (TPR) repeat protein
LNVQVLLEGSLRIEGDRARIIARLLNTRDGFHLWTFKFNGQIGQNSDIQREAAEAIFRRFRRELKTTLRALVQPPSGNSEAWHHYIRAALHTRDGPLKALEHYHAAVSADSGYALAWAGLSLAAVTAMDWGEAQPAEMLPKALDAARRALALTPRLPEAHQAMGRLKVYDHHDWAAAESAFRKAIELDSTYHEARLHYAALVLVPTGRFHEAVLELHRALELYPDDINLWSQLASALIKARRYEEAMEALEASRKIQPVQLALSMFSGMAANGVGDYDGALVNFEQAASIRRTSWVLSHLGYTYARLGRPDDARRVITELDHKTPGKPAFDYEIAAISAGLGDRDAAFAALDRAVANRSQALVWLKVDYLLDSLRPDPRFRAVLQKMRLE